MNPTLEIWDEAYAKGRGGGSTHALLKHYEDGDTIVVHNRSMADYAFRSANGRVPRHAIFILSNLSDVHKLRGLPRVLIDHAALDWLGQSRNRKNSEWMELTELAKRDRRPPQQQPLK